MLGASSILSLGKITDNRSTGYKRIKGNVRWLILINIGIITLSILQYVVNKSEEERKEVENENALIKRDSILKARYDSSLVVVNSKSEYNNRNTIEILTNKLIDYKLKLDTLGGRITLISDDTVRYEKPIFQMGSNGITVEDNGYGKYLIKLSMVSKNASSKNHHVNIHPFAKNKANELLKIIEPFVEDTDMIIAKDEGRVQNFNLSKKVQFDTLFFYVEGRYDDMFNTTFKISDIYFYSSNDKGHGYILSGQTKNEIVRKSKMSPDYKYK